jgi:hypothetical protein
MPTNIIEGGPIIKEGNNGIWLVFGQGNRRRRFRSLLLCWSLQPFCLRMLLTNCSLQPELRQRSVWVGLQNISSPKILMSRKKGAGLFPSPWWTHCSSSHASSGHGNPSACQDCPCNRPRRSIWMWEVEASTSSRPSAHRWQKGCQPYAPDAFYHPRKLPGTHFC